MLNETLTCQVCEVTWERKRAKGRKPKLCEDCKENPVQVKKKQTLDDEEKRRVAQGRVFVLEERLKARGTYVGQQDVLTQLKEQVTKLEERVEALETRTSTVAALAVEDDGKTDRKRTVVHTKSRKSSKA